MFENWVESAYPDNVEDDAPGVGWLLRNGIHPGWAHGNCLPDRADLLDSLTIPLKYYRDLWLISPCSRDTPGTTLRGGAVVARTPSRDDRVRAAKRVLSFHRIWGLPSPDSLLPWRSGVVRVPDRDPRCSHELVFKLPGGEDEFLDELGLNVLMIDGYDPQRREKFALTWEPGDNNGWAVEPCSHHRIGRGWRTGTSPLLVPHADPRRLAERLELRDLLVRWAPETAISKEVRDILPVEPIDRFLKNEPATGGLHALVLDPPPCVERSLHGAAILVPLDRPIPEAVRAAWRISWVDRLAARLGPGRLFGPSGVLPVDRAGYLGALAMMLELDEGLMTRTLALAELLVRTLYDGGIGFAGKYMTGTR
jgi:hypothetical protein